MKLINKKHLFFHKHWCLSLLKSADVIPVHNLMELEATIDEGNQWLSVYQFQSWNTVEAKRGGIFLFFSLFQAILKISIFGYPPTMWPDVSDYGEVPQKVPLVRMFGAYCRSSVMCAHIQTSIVAHKVPHNTMLPSILVSISFCCFVSLGPFFLSFSLSLWLTWTHCGSFAHFPFEICRISWNIRAGENIRGYVRMRDQFSSLLQVRQVHLAPNPKHFPGSSHNYKKQQN